jgi:hypothetical protein
MKSRSDKTTNIFHFAWVFTVICTTCLLVSVILLWHSMSIVRRRLLNEFNEILTSFTPLFILFSTFYKTNQHSWKEKKIKKYVYNSIIFTSKKFHANRITYAWACTFIWTTIVFLLEFFLWFQGPKETQKWQWKHWPPCK